MTFMGNSKNKLMIFKRKYAHQYRDEVFQKLKKAYDDGDIEATGKKQQCAKLITVS
jgi:hypothetical protein